MWRSTNGGANWTGPINLPSNSFCDPSVGWSTDGQTAYTTSLLDSGTAGGAIYRSTDAGVTWTQGASFGNGSNSDKEYLHVDSATTSPYKDNLYVSWHENNVQKFVRSTDKGATFGPTLTIDSGFVGIGSDIASDKDGNVYYFFPTSSGARQVRVAKSTNGGTSFAAGVKVADTKAQFDFPLPSMPSRRAFIYVSADADLSNGPYANSIYVAWPDTYDTENESSATANHELPDAHAAAARPVPAPSRRGVVGAGLHQPRHQRDDRRCARAGAVGEPAAARAWRVAVDYTRLRRLARLPRDHAARTRDRCRRLAACGPGTCVPGPPTLTDRRSRR